MPRLSVLMTAFRSQATIATALRSTLAALPRDSELVVTIDGPDAETLAAAQVVEDRRLRVSAHPVNLGVGGQAAALLERTDSELVARLDADDVCLPWRFLAELPRISKSDFVFGSAIRFGNGRFPAPTYPSPLNAVEVETILPFVCPLIHSSVLMRRSVLDSVGGYKEIRFAEDYELWVRAAAAGKSLEKLAIPVVGYRLSPAQVSAAPGVHDVTRITPELWASHRQLTERLGIPAWNANAKIPITTSTVNRLVERFRPINRRYARSQIEASAQVLGDHDRAV